MKFFSSYRIYLNVISNWTIGMFVAEICKFSFRMIETSVAKTCIQVFVFVYVYGEKFWF